MKHKYAKPIQKVRFFFEGAHRDTGEIIQGVAIENVTTRDAGIEIAKNTFMKHYATATAELLKTEVLKTIK